ncbi:Sporulation initiation phosphotransferase [Lentibacillus sp. JNUCC-1]|uniref:Spo0B domain-containing protein n=1 Tax=Lentibacillus sp. JNUCC-1 TaxID=2654513 RepID=UPI0013249E87|nr:Spo0B domain-containing protein [Lentibacillus sp. JNUCC-1]MUV39509.1 Sporulation initiation phosphotransferase [Lentibacillus sp. JNUCC-1]
METKEVIDTLTHYRHDLLNQLQVIHGYLGMGKPDKAEEKLSAYTSQLDQERRLMHLGLPDFALWVIRFNMEQTHFRLTYKIESHPVSPKLDQKIVKSCETLFQVFRSHAAVHELHQAHLHFHEERIKKTYIIHINMTGTFVDAKELKKQLQHKLPSVIVHKEDKQLGCILTFEQDE